MEFESPDVERDFPGLYASESGKRSDGSDFSDDSHEKISKKDLLIGKRKDKKDSKKDRGYATLEGESSPEEDPDIKSPSKTKKSKTFKFSSKKDKREKSRDKDGKEKEIEKDKKKPDEKDKDKKKDKVKLRLKDKKKSKQDDSCESEDLPVFGVPLSIAAERSKCHDGVGIPLVVRQCIDHVQQTGLTAENVYKVSGIKSRVQLVKRMYNQGESVNWSDFDLPIATSLLKLFLRELPEPIWTKELSGRFEEVSNLEDTNIRVERLKLLLNQVPRCNKITIGWLARHFENVCSHEKTNKMTLSILAATLSASMQSTPRVLSALIANASLLFPQITITRYVPPQTSGNLHLPENAEEIGCELKKQESLLEQLHSELNRGQVSRSKEEQLWDVQRVITQLKRKLRTLERASGISSGHRSLDDTDSSLRYEGEDLSLRPAESPVAAPRRSIDELPIAAPRSDPPWVAVAEPPRVLEPSRAEPRSLPLEPQPHSPPVDPWPSHEPNSLPVWTDPLPVANELRSQPDCWAPQEPSGSNKSLTAEDKDDAWLENRREEKVDIGSWQIEGLARHTDRPPSLNHFKTMTAESLEVEDINRSSVELADKKQLAIMRTKELTRVIKRLRALCQLEVKEIARIRDTIIGLGGHPDRWYVSTSISCNQEDELNADCSGGSGNFEKNEIIQRRRELLKETKRLQMQKDSLVKSICAECDMCIDLRVYIKHLKMSKSQA